MRWSGTELGRCLCGGTYESGLVDIRMNVGGDTVVLEGLAQGVCPECGAHVFRAADLEAVEAVLRRRPSSTTWLISR